MRPFPPVLLPVLLLALALASSAQAQGPDIQRRTIEIAGTFGVADPTGEFDEYASSGLSLGGHLGIFLSSRTSIGLGVLYNNFSADERYDAVGVDEKLNITTTSLELKHLIGRSQGAIPYFRGSVGACFNREGARWGARGEIFEVSDSETKAGTGMGFGVQLPWESSGAWFAEAIFWSDFTSGGITHYLGYRVGFSYFVRAPGRG